MDIQTHRTLFGAASGGESGVDPGHAVEHVPNYRTHAVEPYVNGGKDVAVYLSYQFQLAKFNTDGTEAWNRSISGHGSGNNDSTLAVDISGLYFFTPDNRAISSVDHSGNKRWTSDYNSSNGGGESFNSRGAVCYSGGYVSMTMAGFPGPSAGQAGYQYAIPWYGVTYSNGNPVYNLNGTSAGTRAWYVRSTAESNGHGEARYIQSKPNPALGAGVCTVYFTPESNRVSFWRYYAYDASSFISGCYRSSSGVLDLALGVDPSGNAYITDVAYGGTYYNTRLTRLNPDNTTAWIVDLYGSVNVYAFSVAADDEAVYVSFRGGSKTHTLVKLDSSTGAKLYELEITANTTNMNGFSESYVSVGVDHVYMTLPYSGYIKLPKDGSTTGTFGSYTIASANTVLSTVYYADTWTDQVILTRSAPYYGPQDINNPQYGDEYYNNLLKTNTNTVNAQTVSFNSQLLE